MKAEKPAEGILRTHNFGNSKWYHVVCGCGQPDHALTVEVEADECGINVNTYATVKTDYWNESVKKRYDIENEFLQECDWFWKDLWNGFVTRLKLTWNVWTNGYIETQTTITMSKQRALNFADTLESAIKDVEQFESSHKSRAENKRAINEAEQGDCV